MKVKVFHLPPYNAEKEGRPHPLSLIGVNMPKETEQLARKLMEQNDVRGAQRVILDHLESWYKEALFQWRLTRFMDKWLTRRKRRKAMRRKRQ